MDILIYWELCVHYQRLIYFCMAIVQVISEILVDIRVEVWFEDRLTTVQPSSYE